MLPAPAADPRVRPITFGLHGQAELRPRRWESGLDGIRLEVVSSRGPVEIASPLVGEHNVMNLLGAIGVGLALDMEPRRIGETLSRVATVPGRFERVEAGQPFLVVVDYAHTDDALRNLLAAARELHAGGRIITLFGCGGNRDRSKRPLMGEAAGRNSDVVVLTSDNPRGEDPLYIINDALVGLQRTPATVLVEPDRQRAIGLAIDQARAGDVVLLAGKGHETVQVLKDRSIPFDDREIAREALRARGYVG
jgi:UDP-N-acetylmuramoyl-L-alanyl-D-glutamate--2,6-diaminopimelate ligase